MRYETGRKSVSNLKSQFSYLNERSLTYWKKVIEREDNSRVRSEIRDMRWETKDASLESQITNLKTHIYQKSILTEQKAVRRRK